MSHPPIDPDEVRNLLVEIGATHMPFGRFGPDKFPPDGVPIHDLPIDYLEWFSRRGFPKGRLGDLLQLVWETKRTGADEMFNPLRWMRGGRTRLVEKLPVPRIHPEEGEFPR